MAIIAISGLLSCDGSTTLTVDLRGVTAEVAVAMTTDAQGQPQRVSASFGVDNGRITFGQPPQWSLDDAETTLLVVGLDAAAISGRYESYLPRDGQARIEQQAPALTPALDGNAPLSEPELLTTLGPDAFVLDAAAGGLRFIDAYPMVQAQLRLRLPVDAETCPPRGERRLYPFGPETDGILDDVFASRDNQRLQHSVALDRDTALVVGPGVFVVRRGQRARRGRDTHDAPDVWIPPNLLWEDDGGQVRTVSLRPPDANGVRRGVIVIKGARRFSWIHEIEFGPAGVRHIRTATRTRAKLSDIDLDENNRIVAVDEQPRLIIGTFGQDDLRWLPITDAFDEGVAVRWTGQPETPVAIGADRAVFLSNATIDRWGKFDVTLVGEAREVSELIRIPARNEMWAAGSRASLVVRPGRQGWEQLTLTLPPRFEPCAIPNSDLRDLRSLRNVDALVADDDYLYMSQENCNAVIALRLADRCVAVLTPDGQPARVVVTEDGDDKQLRGASHDDGLILMVGDEGRVLTNLPP